MLDFLWQQQLLTYHNITKLIHISYQIYQYRQQTVADFTPEVNPHLTQQPLNFNAGLAKLGLMSSVKYATCVFLVLSMTKKMKLKF